MKSVIQTKKQCFVCATTSNLHLHHVFYGSSNRKMSDKYGLTIYLCADHHTGSSGIHFNKALDEGVKMLAQSKFEELYGSRDEFRRLFSKSVL